MMASARRSECAVRRIVSGGQTGVDEGALDAALELGIEHGGWCPRGRRSERGTIPARFALTETETANYAERTRLNVRDSDGTLIIHRGPLTGGTRLTRDVARRLDKPVMLVDLESTPIDLRAVRRWIDAHRIEVLNVAGPRESTSPGIQETARALVRDLLE